jgi:uncharacterized protein (TIRG00374 family)
VNRSVPQLVSAAAVAVGIILFVSTIYFIDFDQTAESARRLGFALPLILLPGTCWHALRTWGWWLAFPDTSRPPFTRLIRVRLAADAIGFFTVRGVTGDPLKVLLLIDRTRPEISTAAIALERLAFAVMNTLLAGLVAAFAVTRLSMTGAWDTVFILLSVCSVVLVVILGLLARRRSGDYLGRFVTRIGNRTGRHLEASRVVRFLLDVEDALLDLLRGERKRLLILMALPIVCLALMAAEVWLVLWAVGQPLKVSEALTIETFARLASVASAAIPANFGALEASNAAVVAALGLAGGGSLALTRRVRALLWAGLGLALYPRLRISR